jgi:hypothetical protein
MYKFIKRNFFENLILIVLIYLISKNLQKSLKLFQFNNENYLNNDFTVMSKMFDFF